MDVIYGLIPLVLLLGFLVVLVFIYMAKSGQFDDLDGAANSIFMDDEYEEDQSASQKIEQSRSNEKSS
jgi:cbb3-type cytochrome oxidase maturation protein